MPQFSYGSKDSKASWVETEFFLRFQSEVTNPTLLFRDEDFGIRERLQGRIVPI